MKPFIQKHPYLFWSGTGVAAFGLVCLLGLLGYIQYRYTQLPSVEKLRDISVEVPMRIYSHDGQLLGEFGEIRRTPLNIDQIPKPLIQAFLSAEDDEFYEHGGIDFSGLLRSAYVNLRSNSKAQGASTITMQMARNYFLSNVKTWRRKRDEIILAWKIENEFSKDEILELYLNKIYFGNRAYGIAAAAQVYYGKSVSELTLPEMAMIAGLPKAPSRYNPVVNPKRATQRRNYVLRRMRDLGHIDAVTYRQAIGHVDDGSYHSQQLNVDAYYIAEMVRQEMQRRYGDEVNQKGFKVYTTIDVDMQRAANRALRNGLLAYSRRHGFEGALENIDLETYPNEHEWEERISQYPSVNRLHPAIVVDLDDEFIMVYHPEHGRLVITAAGLNWAAKTLDDDMEEVIRKPGEFLKKGDIVYIEQKAESWWLAQAPEAEAAFVAMSPENGAIKALVGGFDYFKSKYNRATLALRQPGSNFKPFIYSAALEKGYTTATIINDAPIEDEWWRPQNADYKFEGPMPMRRALARSKNMVAIRILRSIGVDYARDYARRFGFGSDSLPDNLTLALGTGEVTPLKLAQGFSVFANGGFAVESFLILRIEDSAGNTLWTAPVLERCDDCLSLVKAKSDHHNDAAKLIQAEENKRLAPRVISEQNAYQVTSMLQDVIRYGTGRDARALQRRDIAGKTGTTNNQKDAWFTGFNRELVATAWVGYDKPQSLGWGEYGGTTALPIWLEFMRTALRGIPDQPLTLPPDMTMVRIDPETGKRACSGDIDAVFEPFPLDKAPKECSTAAPKHDELPEGEDNPFISS